MKGFRPGQTSNPDVRDTELRIVSAANMAEPFMQLQVRGVAPDKTLAGMIVYASGAPGWDPGSGEGVYRRNAANTLWVFLG